MHVLVTYKNEEDKIKNESAGVATTFFPLSVFGDYSRRSSAANSTVPSETWANFKLLQDLRIVLIFCKNEEDLTKSESARVVTTLNEEATTQHESARVVSTLNVVFQTLEGS